MAKGNSRNALRDYNRNRLCTCLIFVPRNRFRDITPFISGAFHEGALEGTASYSKHGFYLRGTMESPCRYGMEGTVGRVTLIGELTRITVSA